MNKLSELIKANAEKYAQTTNTIYAGEDDGKRQVCVLGLCAWELFPERMPEIISSQQWIEDEEDEDGGYWAGYDEESATEQVQDLVLHHFGIDFATMLTCTDGDGLVGLNDTKKLSFIQIADKLEACGL